MGYPISRSGFAYRPVTILNSVAKNLIICKVFRKHVLATYVIQVAVLSKETAVRRAERLHYLRVSKGDFRQNSQEVKTASPA